MTFGTITWDGSETDKHETAVDKILWKIQKHIALYDDVIRRNQPEIASEYRIMINGFIKDAKSLNPTIRDVQAYCERHGLSKTSARMLLDVVVNGMAY